MTLPTIEQLRKMPLSAVNDIGGKKRNRIGSSKSVQYKIADCADTYADRAIVIDWYGGECGGSAFGSRQIIRDDDARWEQFIHRGC